MKKLLLATMILAGLNSYVFANQVSEQSVQQDQEISVMRQKWKDNFIPTNDLSGPLLKNYLDKLDADSVKLWNELDKNNLKIEYLWEDTKLNKSTTAGKLKLGTNLYTIYQRLFTLAKAYKTPGAKLYKNNSVKIFLIDTLTELNNKYYNNSTMEYGNWWHWELGITRVVNNILVVLYDDVDKSLIHNYNVATSHFVKRPEYLAESSGAPYSSTKNAFLSTGGNRSDAATVVFVRGLLDNNPKEIRAAVNSLPVVLDTVKSGDGFYQDYSFIQHKDLPYTGTYGQVLLKGLGLIKNSISGTDLDFSPQDNQRLYSVVNNSFLPWLYEGKMLDAVNGRSISRENEQNRDVGIGVMNSIALFISGAQGDEKEKLLQEIKSQLTDSTLAYYREKLPDSLLSYKIINDIAKSNIPVEQKSPHAYMFSDMDRLLYKGNGFASVIAMHSKRVGSYECINGENLKGQRTSDGMTYIYLSGDEDYYNYWSVVDSNYLPGTTSAGKIGKCDEEYRTGRLGRANIAWAGGVVLNQYASAGIHLKVPEHSLKAKKSWFITPDMIVMLGEGIEASEPVVTTIDNRQIDMDSNVKVDGERISVGEERNGSVIELLDHGKKIIYQNLYDQKAAVSRVNRTGDWSDIGTSKGKLEGQFLTIVQDNNAGNDKYGWVIYPGLSSDTVVKPEVLANSTKAQAIQLPGTKVIYANFWRASEIKGIKGLTPLSMIVIPAATGYKISVSSPRRDSRISFQLDKEVTLSKDPDNRVTVDGNTVSVNVQGLRGSSYIFEINNK